MGRVSPASWRWRVDQILNRERRMPASPALLLGIFAASCGPWRGAGPLSVFPLQPVATSHVPLSENVSVALVDDRTACVIVSYEFQVRCVDRSTGTVGVFGNEGEGPGEFRYPSEVFRGPDAAVGVVDPISARATVFTPAGTIVSETGRLPPQFTTIGVTEAMVMGTSERLEAAFDPSATGLTLAGIELGTGVALREKLPSLTELGVLTECAWEDFGRVGAWHPGGWLVFGTCQRDLLFYDAPREVPTPTVVQAPTYTGELPNDRDMDAYRSGMGPLYGGVVPEVVVQQYAERPKIDRIRGRSLRYDSKARLWVATARDRDRHSYLDIYVGTDFKGSLRVRDRLVGFDLHGATLATLVDRAPTEDDAVGIPDRAIHWYDVSGVDHWR